MPPNVAGFEGQEQALDSLALLEKRLSDFAESAQDSMSGLERTLHEITQLQSIDQTSVQGENQKDRTLFSNVKRLRMPRPNSISLRPLRLSLIGITTFLAIASFVALVTLIIQVV
ncbi:unnamed protein product [Didymodactylos carnosus]|uniref:Uncharacterized protein n=1 Tax=Didymodactylos carnosus TaxID=1234261 RepID=A0A8S2D3G4_9BILA|nr:unnamed protein product [Didymodactylos carnosus]CAF3587241.1 unnamed protein product [Didymodactylos carnosus]